MKNFISISIMAITIFTIMAGCEKLDPMEPGILVTKTVDEDSTLPFIEVNGTKLHAETYGNASGPIIIMLHGGPGNDYRYMLNCKKFAEDGYYVVFFDQRGAGLSRRHNAGVFYKETYLEDLRQVIHHYRISANQKVYLMGHSWGAMYATMYINAYPDEIDGAILSEPGGFTYDEMVEYVSKIFSINFFAENSNDAVWQDQFLTGKNHEMLDYKFMLSSIAASGATGDAFIAPNWRLGKVCSQAMQDNNTGFNWTTNLHVYTTKVLFFYSEMNKAYGEEHAKKVSSAYPNVELIKINGVGHDLTYFAFDFYYSHCSNYLNNL
jgi:proline iminopeptidase